MTVEQLLENIKFLDDLTTPSTLSMYIIKNDLSIRHVNVDEPAREDLQTRFTEYLNGRLNNNELNYSPLSEYTDTENSICYYDLQEMPIGLEVMQTVLDVEDQTEFSVENDGFNDIVGFVFLIGNEQNKIALYKKHHQLSVLKQSNRYLSFRKSDTGLTRVTQDILKISDNFDFLQVNQNLVVFSTKTLENNFGYERILQDAARLKFDLISDAELIENIMELEELIIEKKYAKRMVGINASTPVLILPFDKIRTFIMGHPKLKRRLKFNDTNDKIKFHSKKSKELFLDLMTDSFLKSELTDVLYHSPKKNQLTNDDEE